MLYFNHILTDIGREEVPKRFMRCSEITSKPISDCNWDAETGRPAYCGNCRECVTDTESMTDYCLMCELETEV